MFFRRAVCYTFNSTFNKNTWQDAFKMFPDNF